MMAVSSPSTTTPPSTSSSLCSPVHPGARLRDEFMAPLGLSIDKLAATLGVSPRRIRDLTRERVRFSPDTARRLELRFGVAAEIWLDQQRQYDGARRLSLAPVRM